LFSWQNISHAVNAAIQTNFQRQFAELGFAKLLPTLMISIDFSLAGTDLRKAFLFRAF
jgi:hypothetical protein